MSGRSPVRHAVRIDVNWFDLIVSGDKTAEVRKHDRDYQVGDALVMYHHPDGLMMPNDRERSAQAVEAIISHILPASMFPDALHDRYSVLSLVSVAKPYEITAETDLRATR